MGNVNAGFLHSMGIASIIAGMIMLLSAWAWGRMGG